LPKEAILSTMSAFSAASSASWTLKTALLKHSLAEFIFVSRVRKTAKRNLH
jgi:hypothetical protein